MIKPCLLTLDIATITGWALKRRDGTQAEGSENFRASSRESKGMLYRRFSVWLWRMISEESVDHIIYEMPQRFKSVDASEICLAFVSRIREVHEAMNEAVQNRRKNWSEDDIRRIGLAVELLKRYDIHVPVLEGRAFEYSSVNAISIKSFARKALGIKTQAEKREELKRQGVKGISKLKVVGDKIPPHKELTMMYAAYLLAREPKDDNEADAVCIREWAKKEFGWDEQELSGL